MEPPFDADALSAPLAEAASAVQAARAVADGLAAVPDTVARVHLLRGQRTCTVSAGGAWTVGEGPPPEPRAATDRTVVAVLVDERPVGAVEAAGPDRPDAGMLERCAALLSARLAELGGLPRPDATHRLAAHVARLAAATTPDEAERILLDGARDLLAVASALLLRIDPLGRATPHRAVGPLASQLHAAPAETLAALEALTGVRAAVPALDPRIRASGARAFVAVPLQARGRTDALLLLADSAERELEPADLEPLELLATHGAVCLRALAAAADAGEHAEHDPLTGLGHHAAFYESLNRRRAEHGAPAVVLADIDGFRALNAARGHLTGDRVLREVAAALAGVLRRGDELFRVDGDQFGALVAVSEGVEAADVAARLAAAVSAAGIATVAVGAAVPREGESDDDVVERARCALAAARATPLEDQPER